MDVKLFKDVSLVIKDVFVRSVLCLFVDMLIDFDFVKCGFVVMCEDVKIFNVDGNLVWDMGMFVF